MQLGELATFAGFAALANSPDMPRDWLDANLQQHLTHWQHLAKPGQPFAPGLAAARRSASA